MINLDITNKSIQMLFADNEVDVVIHGCNCFHTFVGTIANTLNIATDSDIAFVDKNFSPYGDINNLGTWTNKIYTINGKDVDIYNFYCQYTLAAQGCDSIHWESVYNGLLEILTDVESEHTVAIAKFGDDASSQADFISILTTLIQKNDDELPDINIKVFEH